MGKRKGNQVTVELGYAVIWTSKGQAIRCDAEDLDLLRSFTWHIRENLSKSGRPRRYAIARTGKGHVRMHRLLLNAPDGMDVDHEDRDGLNNCRYNLRLATRSENMRNTPAMSNNRSGVKGIFWEKDRRKWRAAIQVDGKTTKLGSFATKEAAEAAYLAAAETYHGAFRYKGSAT